MQYYYTSGKILYMVDYIGLTIDRVLTIQTFDSYYLPSNVLIDTNIHSFNIALDIWYIICFASFFRISISELNEVAADVLRTMKVTYGSLHKYVGEMLKSSIWNSL